MAYSRRRNERLSLSRDTELIYGREDQYRGMLRSMRTIDKRRLHAHSCNTLISRAHEELCTTKVASYIQIGAIGSASLLKIGIVASWVREARQFKI
ncbi:hypothetical protein FOZ63_022130 [Perkinsus olseni]|uniref:Uncharacterized protein n=1 Tax=Perkinsus olseni TaxID=32597 RepID=A0A7J6ST40_PEROL|nr:hypothetical protein FOZ63_022130 [Perkinsus olseni]